MTYSEAAKRSVEVRRKKGTLKFADPSAAVGRMWARRCACGHARRDHAGKHGRKSCLECEGCQAFTAPTGVRVVRE